MKCRLVIFILVLLLLPVLSFADWADTDDYYEEEDDDKIVILDMDFSGEFPPPGWTIIQNNPEETWDSGYGDSSCTRVQSSDSGPSNEFLISPSLDYQGCHKFYGIPAEVYSYGEEDRSLEQVLWYWSVDDGTELTERYWRQITYDLSSFNYNFDYPYTQPLQFAVRFISEGEGSYSICNIYLYCYESEVVDPGGCGCTASAASTENGFIMTAFMLLIGIVALVVSLKAKRS